MTDMRIMAIIFDMDGVLIDAKEWHYEALNKALSLFGYGISRYDHLVTYDGLPTARKLDMLSSERGLPKKLHYIISELKQIYTIERVHTECKPLFTHEYALSKLKSLGYRLAVASNSIRDSIDLMMTKSNLKQYLEFFLSNQDVTNPKPDPEIYLKAFEKLGLLPQQCLIIEDNPKGIQAAKLSGAHVMCVYSTSDVNFDNITAHLTSANMSLIGGGKCRY